MRIREPLRVVNWEVKSRGPYFELETVLENVKIGFPVSEFRICN
jgi:hypothetical protein